MFSVTLFTNVYFLFRIWQDVTSSSCALNIERYRHRVEERKNSSFDVSVQYLINIHVEKTIQL